MKNEVLICTSCKITLPKTNFHIDKENPVAKVFWGRVKIEMATSHYIFSKKGKVQNLLHHLKYKGIKEIGFLIGEMMGYDLKESNCFDEIDFVVPVPLHKNKLKKRGYNQSEWIAKGISEKMNIPLDLDALIRKVDSKTQTKKTRYKRWENVGEIFQLSNTNLNDKSILLIDDVVTTGASLEACAQVLIKQNCKVFIATIAYA